MFFCFHLFVNFLRKAADIQQKKYKTGLISISSWITYFQAKFQPYKSCSGKAIILKHPPSFLAAILSAANRRLHEQINILFMQLFCFVHSCTLCPFKPKQVRIMNKKKKALFKEMRNKSAVSLFTWARFCVSVSVSSGPRGGEKKRENTHELRLDLVCNWTFCSNRLRPLSRRQPIWSNRHPRDGIAQPSG